MKNSCSLQRHQGRATSRWLINPIALLLALNITAIPSRAASPPPATLMYTASGPVHGGVATIGTTGVTYLTALSANGNPSKVIALNVTGTEKWPPFTPGADMYAIPAL